MSERIALFDFDGTLCGGDSILPFLCRCIRQGEAPAGQLLKAACGFLGYRLNPEKVLRAKECTLSFLKGRTRADCDRLADAFLADYLPRRLLPGMKETMAGLKDSGWRIVIVSASPDIYMHRLPRFLPAEDVLATRCVFDEEGRFTGRVEENCKGGRKPERVSRWLAARGLRREDAELWAWGDSPSDLPMLRMADKAFLVRPGKTLRQALPEAETVSF